MRTEPPDDPSKALNQAESDARTLTCRLSDLFSWETWEAVRDVVRSAAHGVASLWAGNDEDPRTQRMSRAQQGPPPPPGSTGSVVMVGNICVSPRPRHSLSDDAPAVSSTSAVAASPAAPG